MGGWDVTVTHGTIAQTGLHRASQKYMKLHSIFSVSQTVLSEQSSISCPDVMRLDSLQLAQRNPHVIIVTVCIPLSAFDAVLT